MVKQATGFFWTLFFLFRVSLSDAHTYSATTVDAQVDIGGNVTSVALDGANRPNILYHNTTDGELRHARKTEAGWVVTTVDARVSNGWSSQHRLSVAKNGNGDIGAAYYDSGNTELRYAV